MFTACTKDQPRGVCRRLRVRLNAHITNVISHWRLNLPAMPNGSLLTEFPQPFVSLIKTIINISCFWDREHSSSFFTLGFGWGNKNYQTYQGFQASDFKKSSCLLLAFTAHKTGVVLLSLSSTFLENFSPGEAGFEVFHSLPLCIFSVPFNSFYESCSAIP